MILKIETSTLSGILEAVENAVTKEFDDAITICDAEISTEMLVRMAAKHVQKLRRDVMWYDTHERASELKPCINHRVIADRIIEELEETLHRSQIPRAYAYKAIFIMYILFEKLPNPHLRSWWEKTFMKKIPEYLEKTEYFKGIDCRYRLSVVLNDLPCQERLLLDIPIVSSAPRPNYPKKETPIVILNNPKFYFGHNVIQKMENEACQQFFGNINNSNFN